MQKMKNQEILDTKDKRDEVFDDFIYFIDQDGFPTDFTSDKHGGFLHWKLFRHYFRHYPDSFDINRFKVAVTKANARFVKLSRESMTGGYSNVSMPMWNKFAEKYMRSASSIEDDGNSEREVTDFLTWQAELLKERGLEVDKDVKRVLSEHELMHVDAILDSIEAVYG